jgi:uncharacterized damage-inducible protein DinB
VADPILVAARANVAESLEELRGAIDGLSVAELNARIAGEGTNPVAVIATHALESTRAWLSLATAAPVPSRDRPAEFRAVADEDFAAWVDGRIAECLALLDRAETFDPTYEQVASWTAEPEPRTAAWALMHAIAHLGEHVGHAHVMRDVLVNGRPV